MAAPYSGRTIDYLGSGLLASRPAAPNLYPGTVGLYYCTDVGSEKLTAWDGSVWADVGGGFANPMTTAEDIIVGGVAGAPARLGKGADGTFLGVVAGALAYASPPGGSYTGTAGSITLTGSAFSIDPSYVGQTSITTLGTVATGTWNATAISAVKGGTGQTGYTVGDLLYASSTTALSKLAAGTATHVLTSNGAGAAPSWQAGGGGVGLTNWTEAVNTSTPNATVPVVSFTAVNAATNVDVAIISKGSGAFTRQIADNTTTGGNKRGLRAFDGQASRSAASRVASGADSVALGSSCEASGANSVAIGQGSLATAANTLALGSSAQASGGASVAIGQVTTIASGVGALAIMGATADGIDSIGWGVGAATRGVTAMRSQGVSALVANNKLTLWRSTSSTTPAVLTSVGPAAAAAANQFRMSNNNNISQGFWGYVVARQAGSGNPRAMWKFEGMMSRDGGTLSLDFAVTPVLVGSVGSITGWAVAVSVNSGTNSLVVTVTGPAGATVNWTCEVESTEASG